ncbi:MAG: DsbA family protein, partial [Mycobacterium sp.]
WAPTAPAGSNGPTQTQNTLKEEPVADVDLYIDPVCPFSYVTSRWLLDAARATHKSVDLRQMNLAVLNEGNDLDGRQQRMMDRSRRWGRLFAAVTDQHGPDAFARLYEAVGTRIHLLQEEMTRDRIDDVLADNGFDGSLVEALDDSGFDESVKRAHGASQSALGDRAGSPIIVVDGNAYFGPVLTCVPSAEEGVALLNAVLTVATTPGFAVLQRPHGPPTIGESGR